MKQPPKSCLGILGVLVRQKSWTTTSVILRDVGGTTCVHKRLSELIELGFVEKKDNPYHKGRRLYRVAPGVEIVAEVVP